MSDEYLCAIEDFGQQSAEFLGIFNSDLKRLHTLRPFGGSGIREAGPIGGLIYAISHLRNRSEEGTPIALIDAETGQELARERSFVLPEQVISLPRNGMIAVIGGLTEVEFRDARTLALIWTCRPRVVIQPTGMIESVPNALVVSQAPENAIKPQGQLAEGPDGIVRMPSAYAPMTGIFEIDIEAREFCLVPFDPGPTDLGFKSDFSSISPDGCWGLRERVDLYLDPYEELQSDYGKWFLVTRYFELWDLPSQQKHTDIMTAPQPVLIYDRSREEAFSYYDWLHTFDSQQGSFGAIKRLSPKPLSGSHTNPHGPRRKLVGERQKFYWEPDSKGVWLVRRYSMKRAKLDGTTGPLIFPDNGLGDAQRAALENRQNGIDLGEGEAHPHGRGCSLIRRITKPRPDTVRFDFYNVIFDLPLAYDRKDAVGPFRSFPKLTAREIAALLPALVSVKGWTQEAVDEALADLNTRLKKGLENMVSGNGLTLMFKMRGAFLDEWTFFEKLQEKNLVNVPILRKILTTWIEAQGEKQWYFVSDETRSAGPMSGALACLAQHDDTCHDILRRYCRLRDGEHESFARDTVLLGFIERNTLTEIEVLRLAVFFVLLRDQDGRFTVEDGKVVYPWAELGILQAARTFMKPDDFAQLVTNEAAQWGQGAKGIENVIEGLTDDLDLSDPWDIKVHSRLHG